MSRSAAHDQRNAEFREAFGKPFELASAAQPTAVLVPEEAKKLGLAHYAEDVPNSGGARVHWLGNPSPQKILLYFHGKSAITSAQVFLLTGHRWRFRSATSSRSCAFLEADCGAAGEAREELDRCRR